MYKNSVTIEHISMEDGRIRAFTPISIWIEMFVGDRIFTYDERQLVLHLAPKLSGWMFDKDGRASFTLMSDCKFTLILTLDVCL